MKFTFSTKQQMDKYKDAIVLAGGETQLLVDPGFDCKDFANPKNILVHVDKCLDPKWRGALEILKSNDLSPILGNLWKDIDKKTVRREDIEPLKEISYMLSFQ